ncbi:MAG: siphovirus Gp157 family protein [Nitrosomonadaceae bacterium]
MSKSLFKITEDFMHLMNAVEAAEGEITDEVGAELEINKDELEVKAGNYIEFIGDREAFIGRIDAEIKRLQQMKKTNTNLINRLKDSLSVAVSMFGEFTVGLKKVGTRKSTVVEVLDELDVPKEYKTTTITEKIDKKALKEALKLGKVKGARLVENQNLAIK